MRRYVLLFVLLIIFGGVKGQELDSLQIIEKAKDYFKNDYVEKTFKDPYSYELLKIISSPVSFRQDAKSTYGSNDVFKPGLPEEGVYDFFKKKLEYAKAQLDKTKPKGKKYEELKIKYEEEKKSYNDMLLKKEKFNDEQIELKKIYEDPSSLLDEIKYYRIELHCYGANSYGGKILGKYIFEINPKGEVVTKPFKKLDI